MKKKVTDLLLCAGLAAGLIAVCFQFTEGVLRGVLFALLCFLESELLISILRLLLGEPEPQKLPKEEMIRQENQWYQDRQNPAVTARIRPIGLLLCAVSFLLMMTGLVDVGSYAVHGVCCLICTAVCIILPVVFPAYFSFAHLEYEKNRAYTFPIVNALIPLMLSLAAGSIRTLTEFVITDWAVLLQNVLITAVILGCMLRLAAAELRRNIGNWAGVLFFLVIFGLGVTGPLNHVLECKPPEIVPAIVTEYHPGGYRNPPDYDMVLENGEEINFPARSGFGRMVFDIGEVIELEFHEGALGIDYYCYPE